MRSIPQNLIREKMYCVNYLEFMNDANAREYLYIAVRQDHMDKFKELVKHGNFDAEDYGLVLDHGKGSAPEIIRDKMKLLYKCDHTNAISIQDYNPMHG